MSGLHQILVDSCANEDTRYGMSKPFRIGEYVYATDARIISRQRTDAEIEPGSKEPPLINDLPWPASRLKRAWTIPELPKRSERVCSDCGGKMIAECDRCGGTGEYECGSEVDCPDCDGDGQTKCYECENGKVIEYGFSTVRFGEWWLGARYASILARHGARIYPPKESNKPAYFEIGDDVSGLIMPVLHAAEDESTSLYAVEVEEDAH